MWARSLDNWEHSCIEVPLEIVDSTTAQQKKISRELRKLPFMFFLSVLLLWSLRSLFSHVSSIFLALGWVWFKWCIWVNILKPHVIQLTVVNGLAGKKEGRKGDIHQSRKNNSKVNSQMRLSYMHFLHLLYYLHLNLCYLHNLHYLHAILACYTAIRPFCDRAAARRNGDFCSWMKMTFFLCKIGFRTHIIII